MFPNRSKKKQISSPGLNRLKRRASNMADTNDNNGKEINSKKFAGAGPLGISVAWGYGFAILLIVFIFTILVPDADGPSPWDPIAFKKGMVEMIANFRVLDELADLSIVKVADVGEGILIVDLDQLAVSNRKFGYAPFFMAVSFGSSSLLLRALMFR